MYDAVEIKRFIAIFLLKQTLFLVTLMDIEIKLFLDGSELKAHEPICFALNYVWLVV